MSENSHEGDPGIFPSVIDIYGQCADISSVYWSSLRILLLNYVISFETTKPSSHSNNRTTSGSSGRIVNDKRISSLNSEIKKISIVDENKMIQKVIPKLKIELSRISRNEFKISDASLRQSLLNLRDKYFVDATAYQNLLLINRFDELIIYFTIGITPKGDQHVIFSQVSYFVSLILRIGRKYISEDVTEKLNAYSNKQFKKTDAHTTHSQTPTFNIDDIPQSKVFMEIFDIQAVKLQKDISSIFSSISITQYSEELVNYKKMLEDDHGLMAPADFDSKLDYNIWKRNGIQSIDKLLKELKYKPTRSNTYKTNFFLPENARHIYVILTKLVFDMNFKSQIVKFELTKESEFFIFDFAKYWRLDFPTTILSLLYTSYNLSYQNDEELNITIANQFYSFLDDKIPQRKDYLESEFWNDEDRAQWTLNITWTSKQSMTYLDNILSAIYSKTLPKLTPILSIYYEYILTDSSFTSLYKQQFIADQKQWLKKIKYTLFKASEDYYISLLSQMPKDKTLSISNIQDIAEQILLKIQRIQKRYNTPLLEDIYIAFDCSVTLLDAFCVDFPMMLKRVIKYNKPDPFTALETYKVLLQLKFIYEQVQEQDKHFPKIESFFLEFLTEMGDEVSKKLIQVIETSMEKETWEPRKDDIRFSSSVHDIFKMFGETVSLVKKLDWGNDFQVSVVITHILRIFSEGTTSYANEILRLLDSELHSVEIEEDATNQNLASNSIFSKDIMIGKSWTLSNILIQSTKPVPLPYQYTKKSCTLLNNLETAIDNLSKLEDFIGAEELSESIKLYEGEKSKMVHIIDKSKLHQIITITVVEADKLIGQLSNGLSNLSVSLVDQTNQKDIGKTHTIYNSISPQWDQEFNLEAPKRSHVVVSASIWSHTDKNFGKLNKSTIYGKGKFKIDKRNFNYNGFPTDISIPLDTQGTLKLRVAVEIEDFDAVFYMGKIYRSLSNSRDAAIEKIVSKFHEYIKYAFSRETLTALCGNNGTTTPKEFDVYEAVVPLFDYLNANFNVLGSLVSESMLFMIMLKVWNYTLTVIDHLMLPSLSSGENIGIINSQKSFSWSNAIGSKLGATPAIPGYGRSLMKLEIDIIFVWLESLCVDFFHNNGEGPPLNHLQNEKYKKLQLVKNFYGKDESDLIKDVEMMVPEYSKYLQILSSNDFGSNDSKLNKRLATLARKKTIMAHATLKRRKKLDADLNAINSEKLVEKVEDSLDIILRILLAKGKLDFVYKQLQKRAEVKKQIEARKMIRKVIEG